MPSSPDSQTSLANQARHAAKAAAAAVLVIAAAHASSPGTPEDAPVSQAVPNTPARHDPMTDPQGYIHSGVAMSYPFGKTAPEATQGVTPPIPRTQPKAPDSEQPPTFSPPAPISSAPLSTPAPSPEKTSVAHHNNSAAYTEKTGKVKTFTDHTPAKTKNTNPNGSGNSEGGEGSELSPADQFRYDFFEKDRNYVYGIVHSDENGGQNYPMAAVEYDQPSDTLLVASFDPEAELSLAVTPFTGDKWRQLTISSNEDVDPLLLQSTGEAEPADNNAPTFQDEHFASIAGKMFAGPSGEAINRFAVNNGVLGLETAPSYTATTEKAKANVRALFKSQPNQAITGFVVVPALKGGPGSLDTLIDPIFKHDAETGRSAFISADPNDPDHLRIDIFKDSQLARTSTYPHDSTATNIEMAPLEGAPQYEPSSDGQSGGDFLWNIAGKPQKVGIATSLTQKYDTSKAFRAQVNPDGSLSFVPFGMK